MFTVSVKNPDSSEAHLIGDVSSIRRTGNVLAVVTAHDRNNTIVDLGSTLVAYVMNEAGNTVATYRPLAVRPAIADTLLHADIPVDDDASGSADKWAPTPDDFDRDTLPDGSVY